MKSTLTRMTPGPWHYSSGMVWAGEEAEEIAIASADRDEEKTMPTERDANARAISFTPEMIEALKAIVARFDYLNKMEELGGHETGPILFHRMAENGEINKARHILAELSKKD